MNFFFIKHYGLILNIFVSICGWATPAYFVDLTAIAKVFFFTCSLMLKLSSDKILHDNLNKNKSNKSISFFLIFLIIKILIDILV